MRKPTFPSVSTVGLTAGEASRRRSSSYRSSAQSRAVSIKDNLPLNEVGGGDCDEGSMVCREDVYEDTTELPDGQVNCLCKRADGMEKKKERERGFWTSQR